jgi:hypothetical protein
MAERIHCFLAPIITSIELRHKNKQIIAASPTDTKKLAMG